MDQVFENNPKLDKYFKASDGTPFYNETDAKSYAGTLQDKIVVPVTRKAKLAEGLTVKKTIAAIETAGTIEALEAFEVDTREGVAEALEAKRAELAKGIEVIGEKENTKIDE